VNSGISLTYGFKEAIMKKVANYVLDLKGIAVSNLQLYNHTRKWRNKRSIIRRLRTEGKFK
jgi:hypothetical protein